MDSLTFFFAVILPFCGPVWIVYDFVKGDVAYGLEAAVPFWILACLVANAILLHRPDQYQAPGGRWRSDWEPPEPRRRSDS